MALGAQDGSAFIGYAGLGITARGTEPADWMVNCLLDVNAPLEECLDVIADCANRELPRNLVTLPPTGRDMEIERCYGRDRGLHRSAAPCRPAERSASR